MKLHMSRSASINWVIHPTLRLLAEWTEPTYTNIHLTWKRWQDKNVAYQTFKCFFMCVFIMTKVSGKTGRQWNFENKVHARRSISYLRQKLLNLERPNQRTLQRRRYFVILWIRFVVIVCCWCGNGNGRCCHSFVPKWVPVCRLPIMSLSLMWNHQWNKNKY